MQKVGIGVAGIRHGVAFYYTAVLDCRLVRPPFRDRGGRSGGDQVVDMYPA